MKNWDEFDQIVNSSMSEEVLPKLSTLLKLAKTLDANINLNPNQESIIKIERNKKELIK